MTLWDWFILAAALALVLEGLFKGAIRLGFGLAGLVAGGLYAGLLADKASAHLSFLVESLRRPVALVAGFLLIFALFVVVGVLASTLVKAAGLSLLNRLLGALLGFLVAVYLAGFLVAVGGRLSPQRAVQMTKGPVMRFMVTLAFGVETLIPSRPLPSPPAPSGKAAPAPPRAPSPVGTAPKTKGDAT